MDHGPLNPGTRDTGAAVLLTVWLGWAAMGCATWKFPDPGPRAGGRGPPGQVAVTLAVERKVGWDEAEDRAALLDTLQQQGGMQIQPVSQLAGEGVGLSIRIRDVPASDAADIMAIVSMATATIVPAFSGSEGLDVRFELRRQGKPAGTYEYRVRRQVLIWLPLLPFVWVNLITPDRADALRGVARQFLHDSASLR
jgi:hypothetical protein